jgi:5-methyltetrahydrofolate--homocysteine methyltransferase
VYKESARKDLTVVEMVLVRHMWRCMNKVVQSLFDAFLVGNADLIKEKVQLALESYLDPSKILNEGMISALSEVGDLFERGEFFVPEMSISARAMKQGLWILKPH